MAVKPNTKVKRIIESPRAQKSYVYAQKRAAFFQNGTVAAFVMVLGALLALLAANSFARDTIQEVLQKPIGFTILEFHAEFSLSLFINDFLMAIFFLLVGIELKYEVCVGALRRPNQALLPCLAALGGCIVPSVLYVICNLGQDGQLSGWAIPMATDIAFALGVLSLLGKRISPQAKVFFSTLAIADDLFAIIVIAFFYGHAPNVGWLIISAICALVLFLFNRLQNFSVVPYIVVGAILWFCMEQSGIHATLAGIILAFALPATSSIRTSELTAWLKDKADDLGKAYKDNSDLLGQHEFMKTASTIETIVHHVTPPLERVQSAIVVPVNFIILPIFAFANAQLSFAGVDAHAMFANSVTIGVLVGACLGKPIGIVGVTALLSKTKAFSLPKGMTYKHLIALGIMGGLGFTMSMLFSNMAFTRPDLIEDAKVAILLGSVISAVLGCLFILFTTQKKGASHANN